MKNETHSVSSSRSLTSRLIAFVAIAVVSAWGAGSAWAKDSVEVTVTNATGKPLVVNNGQATGIIQLFYTVDATAFTAGQFATFDLNWKTILGKPATDYGVGVPFELVQSQQGGFVDLVPSSDTFLLTKPGQNDVSHISVYIATDKSGNMPPTVDRTDLVGNLKLDAGSKVGTVTNIQVHILLMHPKATACLNVYTFVTDQDFNLGILETTSVKIGTSGAKAGKVVSSQPNQFSDNVLIANSCVTNESFDLRIAMDDSFETNPNGNPGNAVFSYTAEGEFDTSNFATMMIGDGTSNRQNLCLQNVTVPAGASFLATVHSAVKKDAPQASLPADGSFDFSGMLYQDVNAGCSGLRHSQASPNPDTFTLPFTTTK